MANSRGIRGEIKPLVVSVQTSKTETHGKICSAISKSVEEAKTRKVSLAEWKEEKKKEKKFVLPGRESNPGLPRDRRRYLPLYYRGMHM